MRPTLLAIGALVCSAIITELFASTPARRGEMFSFEADKTIVQFPVTMQHLDNAQCTKTKPSGEKEVCYRERTIPPNKIFIRYTRGTTADAAIKTHYTNGTSYNYMIDENGNVIELVDPANVSFCAGHATFRDCSSFNQQGISVGLVTFGFFYEPEIAAHPVLQDDVVHIKGSILGDGYYVKYKESQILNLGHLLAYLQQKYKISKYNVVLASDTSVGGDPGPLFPVKYLAEKGLMFYPHGNLTDDNHLALLNDDDYIDLIKSYGYAHDQSTEEGKKNLIRAFNTRFWDGSITNLDELTDTTKKNIGLIVAKCKENPEPDTYFISKLKGLIVSNPRIKAFCEKEGVHIEMSSSDSSSSSSSSHYGTSD